ncbi:hypothetical protein EVAR_23363_1 [Eumeta japonica]|uniref:Uncharacterized protein n=1 Tax=Eumeta variegata TaxID=151549 RepID=A0A4C1VY41_EUMVA|nr:hypothetical protein EVAR_23363_1 [Eumeta japonica]
MKGNVNGDPVVCFKPALFNRLRRFYGRHPRQRDCSGTTPIRPWTVHVCRTARKEHSFDRTARRTKLCRSELPLRMRQCAGSTLPDSSFSSPACVFYAIATLS